MSWIQFRLNSIASRVKGNVQAYRFKRKLKSIASADEELAQKIMSAIENKNQQTEKSCCSILEQEARLKAQYWKGLVHNSKSSKLK